MKEKKETYLLGLERLSLIRTGFDITIDFPYKDEQVNDLIQQLNHTAIAFSAKMRLYASDDIYYVYQMLSDWQRFSFTKSSGSWRLFQDGKEIFSVYVTFLARIMQEDLGYREYVKNPEMIICPDCGKEHDPYRQCSCGLTWRETMNRYSFGFMQARDEYAKETEETGNTDS